MSEVTVNFVNTDGRMITVNLDDTTTAQEAIAELISAEFIVANPQGYQLGVKGGAMLDPTQTFRDMEIENGTTIKVVPATDAGQFIS
jgi:hypothetical protein